MSDDELPRRLHLRWTRTIIGGQTAPYDFNAWDDERSVARIYWQAGGHVGGGWFWTKPLLGKTVRRYQPVSGTVYDNGEAAHLCEDGYFRLVAALR